MPEEPIFNIITGTISHPFITNIYDFIFNSSYRLLNLHYTHIHFDVHPRNLEIALKGIGALNIQGINVLPPHNENVIKYLDEVNGEASTINLVNTVVNEGDRLIGYNTHIFGLNEILRPFKDEIAEKQISIFGAGNLSKTLLYTLIKNYRPKNINLFNRDLQRAEQLIKFVKEELNFNTIKAFPFIDEEIIKHNEKSKLVINATPIGSPPKINDSIIENVNFLKEGQIIFDMVLSMNNTKLIVLAKQHNLKTITGLDFLLYHTSKTFELWVNKEIPINEVKKIVLDVYHNEK